MRNQDGDTVGYNFKAFTTLYYNSYAHGLVITVDHAYQRLARASMPSNLHRLFSGQCWNRANLTLLEHVVPNGGMPDYPKTGYTIDTRS